ncbi:hypothetical protein CDAR_116651 [Caerostris darwini]|uniref:Uncharacterized protein n=1 Tax=Caerostris darwini TaxID=1538125 RepID=A0AAV4R4M0_9ARAC|nr:hypothetical protein CDAR_116651 [Caerostris darwini]
MVMCVHTSLPLGEDGGELNFSSHANAGRSLLEDVAECRDIDYRCYQRCKISVGFMCIRVGTWNSSDAKDSLKRGCTNGNFHPYCFPCFFQER